MRFSKASSIFFPSYVFCQVRSTANRLQRQANSFLAGGDYFEAKEVESTSTLLTAHYMFTINSLSNSPWKVINSSDADAGLMLNVVIDNQSFSKIHPKKSSFCCRYPHGCSPGQPVSSVEIKSTATTSRIELEPSFASLFV